jgi:tetratricopeptide (TPR) repeat protein
VVSPSLSAAEVAARLAEADAMAARGCYLCLREASAAYLNLLALSDNLAVVRHALENELMVAMREKELRLPDSGAVERAKEVRLKNEVRLKADTTYDYDLYFSLIAAPAAQGVGMALMLQREEERKAQAAKLEAAWPTSVFAAYVYLPMAALTARGDAFRQQAAAIGNAHPGNLAVKYRGLTMAYTDADALSILEQEPRFGELHYLRGQRAVGGTDLVNGHREYSVAYEALPESLAVAVSFGGLELAFSRHAQALALFDKVLVREPDHDAQLGRAMALSSLRRHAEAIAYLDELLTDPSWRPGDKYYWRAWNYLQLAKSQAAYDDANAALKSMANSNVYQLAGIASYQLSHVPEARSDFENSVQMNAANCDSIRYIGIIDAAERLWPAAFKRFTTAAGCYGGVIARLESELAEKQADTSGLFAGQIAGLVAEIAEAKALLDASTHNAEVAAKQNVH